MSPPIVYEVTMPTSQSKTRIITMVINMDFPPRVLRGLLWSGTYNLHDNSTGISRCRGRSEILSVTLLHDCRAGLGPRAGLRRQSSWRRRQRSFESRQLDRRARMRSLPDEIRAVVRLDVERDELFAHRRDRLTRGHRPAHRRGRHMTNVDVHADRNPA